MGVAYFNKPHTQGDSNKMSILNKMPGGYVEQLKELEDRINEALRRGSNRAQDAVMEQLGKIYLNINWEEFDQTGRLVCTIDPDTIEQLLNDTATEE